GDAVSVIFAGEKVRPEYVLPAPDVIESEPAEAFRVLRLDALVRMKLTSFRDKDRTHVRDLISVGLVDESWLLKLPGELGGRLQTLLENSGGWPKGGMARIWVGGGGLGGPTGWHGDVAHA